MSEKAEKLNKLARDVLILSRNTLLVNLRFLDAALSQFAFLPIEESTLLTDGKHILYNPRHILENYKIAKEIPASVIRIGRQAFYQCSGLTIHGKAGSYAEAYAKSNKIPFVAE